MQKLNFISTLAIILKLHIIICDYMSFPSSVFTFRDLGHGHASVNRAEGIVI